MMWVWVLLWWGLLAGGSAHAQLWSGTLDASRAIDWQANGNGVPGGIPTNRTQCGSVYNPEGTSGTPVSPATLESTINACAANTYLLLGAGGFYYNGGITITASNVTLRGSGPDQTTINFTGQDGCLFGGMVCIKGASNIWAGTPNTRSWETNWTAGYAKGTTQITVGSTANTAAGRFVWLDQLDDQTDGGGIVNSPLINTFSGEGIVAHGRCESDDGGSTSTGANCRTQGHMHKVVSVDSGTQLTITPGIQMPNYRAGQSPQMYGIGTSSTDVIQGVGIENITLRNVSVSNNGQNAIVEFANAYGSWAKNVRTLNGLRDHYTSHQSAHIEIRDCYLYGAATSGSQSYGIESQGAADNLYVNNILHYTTAPFIGACPGCVIIHNYTFANHYTDGGACVDTGPNNYSTCNWASAFSTHNSGGGMDLWEGNDFSGGVHVDLNHGTSPLGTYVRNRLGGSDDNGVTTKYRNAATLQTFSRGYNFIGNVLGVSGVQTIYSDTQAITSSSTAIYSIGYNGYGNVTNQNDATARSSAMRWGNFDVVTNAVRWCGNSSNTGWVATCSSTSEVPTAGIQYLNGNAVPSTETVPNSFYFSAQPSYWVTVYGTPAWPPIGPEVTGGALSGYGGRVHKIPARLCFENAADDPAYPSSVPRIKAIDAATCISNTGSTSVTSKIGGSVKFSGGVTVK